MLARSVCFAMEKLGSTPLEWEDAAGHHDGLAEPRFVVVDGATEAYDSVRWVEQLVTAFLADRPAMDVEAFHGWFATVQRRWVEGAPRQFASIIEELKFTQEGSFATFLGATLTGLDGPSARWEAAALGDTVLFHVRDETLVEHFPPIGIDDFGLSPDGVSTQPGALRQMLGRLAFARGDLRAGDLLFVATDAIAHWVLGELARNRAGLWRLLAELDHDATFAALVAGERAAGRLRNDDVTLLRVEVVAAQERCLVVCL